MGAYGLDLPNCSDIMEEHEILASIEMESKTRIPTDCDHFTLRENYTSIIDIMDKSYPEQDTIWDKEELKDGN